MATEQNNELVTAISETMPKGIDEIKQAVLTDDIAHKKEQLREYHRQYRANNLEKLKAANIEWKLKNADKIKEERKTNAPKYAAIQRAYDLKKRDDPHYIALYEARQLRYREQKKLHPENYKQKDVSKNVQKPRGRPRTRGVPNAPEIPYAVGDQ